MAFTEARSGLARCGAVHTGLTLPYFDVLLGGVDVTSSVQYEGFVITHHLQGISSLTFSLAPGVTPVFGQPVLVRYARPDDYLFTGTVIAAETAPFTPDSAELIWHVSAIGDEWLLNRYALVNGLYSNVGVNVIASRILAEATDGGFVLGQCDQSLGNLTIQFTFSTVVEAFDRIAAAIGGYWRVSNRIVEIFDTPPLYTPPTLTNNSDVYALRYGIDGSRLQTRKIYKGSGASTTSPVTVGATTVPLESVSAFAEAGGTATVQQQTFTYTGISDLSLTGVSGITADIPAGEQVSILVTVDDTAAQTALAALLGGGLSGIVTDYHQDERLSIEEATARATSDLAAFSEALPMLEYSDTDRYLRIGQSVTATITAPLSISDTFRIQAISITPRGKVGGRQTDLWRRVTASPFIEQLSSVLRNIQRG
jgi:hypothetical protein